MNVSCDVRRGFTAIELMVVIGIMILMVSLAVPTMAESLQRTKVSNAANAIQVAHNQARFLARTEGPAISTDPVSGQAHYGVRVTADHVEVIYNGSTLVDEVGRAIASFPFRSDVAAVVNGAAANVAWEYQFGTGYPIVLAAHSYAVPGTLTDAANVGMAVSAGNVVCTNLGVRTVDGTAAGRHHAAIRIYKSGLCHVEME